MLKVDGHGAVGIIKHSNLSWKYWIKKEAKEAGRSLQGENLSWRNAFN